MMARSLPHIHRLLALPLLVLLLGGCGSASPTSTPSGCAAAIPSASHIVLSGLPYPIVFPPGTVGTQPATLVDGPGLFAVSGFQLCTPDTTPSAVLTYYNNQLPAIDHGWFLSQTFPGDGGLMSPCPASASCWYDNRSENLVTVANGYLRFDQFAVAGSTVVYRARFAVPPAFPPCYARYVDLPNNPTTHYAFFLPQSGPAVPVPPVTFMAPDNVAGTSGWQLCSPGTDASVVSFMTRELAATGWQHVRSDPRCVYQDECWLNGGQVISWNVSRFNAGDWRIAWRSLAF